MAEPSHLSVKALPLAQAAGLWDAFSQDDCFGVAQSRHWVECWAAKVNAEIFCGVIFEGDAPVLVLPVEVIRDKACRVARYIGGSHANANFPLLRKDRAGAVTAELTDALFKALFLAIPKLDAVLLARQQPQISGVANPFAALPSQPSPNLALSFALEPSFENLIKHRSGARKLKKMRQQARRMDERGGWECAVANDGAEAARMLDGFFVMKAKRFEEFGLKNTFERQEIKDFFKALFGAGAPGPAAQFRLDALRVGGDILAVAGSTMRHHTNIVEFGAVRAHEPTLSPGDFLFHQIIKRACENGAETFDFGVGDEPYKRAWCDIETQHFETVRGSGARGFAYAQFYVLANKAKLAIKRNPLLFDIVRRTRLRKASSDSAAEAG
jgi:CelD/BcsL family acetyltransferase involved in cellulose biosynthesis